MPTYDITDPQTGLSATLQGDSPPSEAELDDVFKSLAGSRPSAPAARLPGQPMDIGEQLRSAYGFQTDPNATFQPFESARQLIEKLIPSPEAETEAMRLTGVKHVPTASERVAMKAKGALETIASPGGAVLGTAGILAPEVVGPVMAATAVPQVAENVREISRGDVAGGVAGLAINAPMLAGALAPLALRESARTAPLTTSTLEVSKEALTQVIPPERQLAGIGIRMPEFQEGPIGPEPRSVTPESRQLPAPLTPMPEFTESTLDPNGPAPLALPAPGETLRPNVRETTAEYLSGEKGNTLIIEGKSEPINLPSSPLAEPRAGHRISLPLELESAKAARQIWSKPIDVEAQVTGADALRSLVSLTDETKTPGEPYQPPSVNVDLRQLERMMQRNTVSRVESWADETIRGKLREAGANPYFDPEFLAAAAVKAAILVKRGVSGFADWSARMKEQFGPGIEGHLPALYDQATQAYGATNDRAVASVPTIPPAVEPASSAPTAGQEVNQAGGTGGDPPAVSAPTSGGDEIFGIADRIRREMADTGNFTYTPPGPGTNEEVMVQRGRALLRQGADPEAILSGFARTQRFSSDDLAALRAHAENLAQEASRIGESKGAQSPEAIAARARVSDTLARVKPMQTEWHRMGEAQQGATDVDTGDFTAMARSHLNATNEPFTPKQAATAEEISGIVRKTRQEGGKAQQELVDAIDKATAPKKGEKALPKAKTLEEARAQFAANAGTGRKLTPQQARTLWSYAKDTFVASGENNIDAIAQGTADAFGLPKKTVMEAIAGPKSVREIADDMYLKLTRARQAQAAARAWLYNEAQPTWMKIPDIAINTVRALKVLGHGTVGMVTHAIPVAFDPVRANVYWRNFGRQFGLMVDRDLRPGPDFWRGGYHERAMQDLMNRPTFALAKRAGLANDPFRFSDDYQNPAIMQRLGWVTQMGNRGFDVLKLLRQEMFDQTWSKLDPSQRTLDVAKEFADKINHVTGVTSKSLAHPGVWNRIFFAPRLELSRWASVFGDPASAATTFTKWATGAKTTAAERLGAMHTLKQDLRIVGTYFSLLAMNSWFLQHTGSDQEVNWTDPHRSDFLAFKGFGRVISPAAPFTRLLRFVADIGRIAQGDRGKMEAMDDRFSEAAGKAGEYARGKLSPGVGVATDFAFQKNFAGRTMPTSDDKIPKRAARRGVEPFTWGEYITEQAAPIPFEEALREVWDSQGMDKSTTDKIIKALPTFISANVGLRVREAQ